MKTIKSINLFSIYTKILISVFLLVFIATVSLYGQNVKLGIEDYNILLPEGIVHFTIDKSKITICFEDDVTNEQRAEFLKNSKGVFKRYQTDWEFLTESITIAQLDSGVTDESYFNTIKKIQQSSIIKYVAPVLTYKNEQMQALYNMLFVSLRKPTDIDTLKYYAKLYNLEIGQSEGQIIRCYVNKNSSGNSFEIAKHLQLLNLFNFAEPDFVYFCKQLTNDPYYNWQWYLNNTGSNYPGYNLSNIPSGNANASIHVVNAWQISPGGSSNIKVAVLDCFGSVAEFIHPDISFYSTYDATGTGFNSTGYKGDAHGINCAGIIKATGNNSQGLAGIAYNCKIIAVKIGTIYDTAGHWSATGNSISNGITWAYNNADVISNSNGFGSSNSLINTAISNSITIGRSGNGTPFFSATGNSNSSTIAYPASNTNTIAVGATSMCDQRKSPTSCDGENWGGNYGVGLDVSAPGVKIYTTDIAGESGSACGILPCVDYGNVPNGGNYNPSFHGTSAACPVAAGVMALIFSTNPNLTYQDARSILEVTCDKVGGYTYSYNGLQPNGTWSQDLGYGRINAEKAVYSALLTTSCPDYNDILIPTTSWQTDTKTLIDELWIIYKIHVTSGNTYTFKTGCGNGATANFETSLVLLDYDCNPITAATSICSNPSNTEVIDWTATYVGDVYLKVKASNWINGTYTLAYRYTSPVQTCTVSVSPSSKTVSYLAGTTTFLLTGSGNWTISESCPWITNISPSSGNGNATITITYLANGSLSSRSCTLTATCGSTTNNFTLNQNATSLTLSSPANETSGLSCSGINFSWSSNISNVKYRIQISTSNSWNASDGFNTTVYNQNLNSSSSFTWTEAHPNTTYYWCVKAYDVTNQVSTNYTAYRTLYTGSCSSSCSLPITSILGPTLAGLYFHHGCAGNDLVITWTAQSDCNVIEYELAFTNSSGQIQVSELFTQPSFTYPIENNYQYNADLFFIVRSRNAAGWGPYTPLNQLRIFACQNNSCNDPYEPNNSSNSSYLIQPVYFTNDEFYFKTDDACLDDAEDDWDDYYRIDLPSGYYYTVVSRLHDSWDSDDGITYTGDMEYRYFDGSDWSDYEDFQQPTFEVLDGGSLYFRVRPYSNTTGNDGTYSLEATIYRYLPNLKPYKPSGWDEPLIASISLGTHANSGSFTTADNIYIDACQIEDSDAPCGAYNTYIYVDESIVYNTNSAGLQPYDYEWVEDINVGPLSAGWHEIKMVVDYGLNIEESNENDNEYVKSIYVSPIYPDLLQYTPNGWSAPLVTSVTTGTNTDATTIYSTNNVYVDVAFSNISNQNITNSFVSYLYLNNSLVYTFNTPGLNANNYTYANDINIGQLQPGTYELKMIVDGNGQVIETNEGNNIYIKNFTVVCNIPSQPSSINGNTTVCQSSTQTYSVTNVSGVTYTWSVTGGAVISGQGTNSVNIVFTSSGAKTITVTPNINCGSGTSRTLTVIVTGFPAQPSVIVGNTSVCLGGGTQTYSVTNVGGVTYNWSVSGGTFTGSGNTIIVTWNTAGSQSIVVTPYNSCGNGTSRSLTVTINTTPASVNVSGGGTFCNGATLTAIGDNGSTIYWQGTTSNGTSTAIPLSSQTVTSSGTYYFRAFNSCGWGTQGSATVTINPPPVQPGVITGSTTVCKGQTSVTYSITNNPNATNYIWTTPNGTNIETSTPNSITINYSISAVSGNITVKDNNSCGDGPVSILPITVKSVPNEPVLLSENISFCSNEEKTINVSTTGDVSDYTWILPSNFNGFSITDSISITYSPIVQINNNSYLMEIVIPTIYVIANNICGSSTPLSIYPHIFQDTPLMGMIFGDTVICQGQSSITYTAPFIIDTTIHIMSSPINQDLIDYSNDTISYIWTLPNGWTGNSSTNSITCTPGLSGGTITLTAFNACGASIQRSIDVNVITVPPQPQTINGMTSVCPGSSQTYSIPSGSAIIPISLISENFNLIIDSNITDISSSLNSFTSTPNWTAYKIYQSNGKVKLGTSSVKGFIMTPSLDLSGNGGVFTIKFKARKWGNDQSQMKVIVNSTEYIVSELSSTVMSEFIIIASGGTALTTIIFEGFQDANSRFFIDDIDIIQNTDTYSYTWTFPSGWTQTSGGTTNSVTVTAGSGNGNITVTPSNSCGYGTARTLAVNTVGNNFSSLNLYTDQAATPNNELNVTTGQDTKFYIKVDACGDLNRRAQIQFQVYKDGVALTDLGQYLTDQYLSVSYFTEQIGINNPNPSNTYFNPFSIGTYPFANTAQFPPYNGYFVNWNTNAYNWFYMHFFNDRFITVDINAFSQPGQYSIIYNLVGANASCNITDNSTNYTAGLSYGGNGFQYCNNTFILASNTMTINVSGAPITEDFTIQTSSNPSIGGTTTGSGVFFGGSIRTVTATANSGYIFTNWTENGNVVSTDANYSFVLSNNRNLVANFICNLPLPGSVGLISGSSNVCQGDSFVTYSVPLIQNATSYIWALPNGATGTSTSNTITVNYGATATSGEISVKGINSCGEGPVSIREITVNSHPEAAGPISGNTLVCHGENLVLYSIPSIANATAYLWHFPDGEETTTLSNSIYLNYNALTVSGNITVRGINSCGEGIPSNIGVIINPLPSAAGVIIGDSIVCQGQSAITYTVPLIPNAESYVWTLPFGVIGSSTSNSITVNYEAYAISGNITVKGINTCGVGAISTKEIIVNALPAAAGIITGKATVCQGQNEITYTVPTITNAISYLWTLPNGATGSSITNSINVSYGTTAVSGNISIEGTNECGDGIVSIKAINVKPLPAAAGVISGNAIVCQGDSSVFYSIPNIPNATSYVWTLPDGAIGNSTTNSISVNYGTTAVSGYITVKGTNSCGEGIASNMSIFVNSLPDGVGIINGPSSPCENSIVAYSVNNQTTIYDDWFLPSKDELDSVRKKIYLFGLGGFGSGNGLYWTSTELDQNYALFHNFYWNSQQGEVKWNGQNMTFYPIRMFNSSTSYQLRDVGPAGGFIFHIENNQNNVNTYYEVSINSMTADWGCYGTSIGATGTAIGTGLSNTEAIVNGCPSLSNAARLCYDYSVTINNSVIWSVPLGWTIINGQGTNQIEVLVGSNNGTISVTPNNSCGKGDSSNLAINVNPLPVDAGTISGNATVCQGENSVTYTVPVIEYASSYIWTLPNGATGTSTTNSITVDYSTTAISGDISVKGSNACGLPALSIQPFVTLTQLLMDKFTLQVALKRRLFQMLWVVIAPLR
ncbi:MAG: large protein [Bacteroidetes bacterium]|nr:large protein [Bacteroidota bacterium]